jgi:hypothetical protein
MAYTLRITITRIGRPRVAGVPTREVIVAADSWKQPTRARVARLLAEALPAFRRRRGRASAGAGAEILPVIEATTSGWRAWRLYTASNQPSGFEPPIKGRVGKFNSHNNPFADRGSGVWEQADVAVVAGPDHQGAA